MRITYDAAKRQRTLEERGLDFEDAASVFADLTLSDPDDRHDYGEQRWITIGRLHGTIVVIVWTERDDSHRIISMRRAHDHERKRYRDWLDRS